MTNHLHISAMQILVCALGTLLLIGVLNLWAMKNKDTSSLAASYANLYGVE